VNTYGHDLVHLRSWVAIDSPCEAPARLRRPEPRARRAVCGVPKGALRTHSVWQALLWAMGWPSTRGRHPEYCLRVRQCWGCVFICICVCCECEHNHDNLDSDSLDARRVSSVVLVLTVSCRVRFVLRPLLSAPVLSSQPVVASSQ